MVYRPASSYALLPATRFVSLPVQRHPDPVVETTSLSYAELPPIKYTLALPGGIYDSVSKANLYGGSLSDLQVKADLSTSFLMNAAAPMLLLPSLLHCLRRTLLPLWPLRLLAEALQLLSAPAPRLQLETIAYACQRHETILPSGQRAGFFLGDGVGLGKGRQVGRRGF